MTKRAAHVGQRCSVQRVVTEQDVESFAALSLDRNPLHFDDAKAGDSFFGKKIAHGLIGAALISGAMTELLGRGSIWLSLDLNFERPIYIGDRLTCWVEISGIERRNLFTLDVRILNNEGVRVIGGKVTSMRAAPQRLGT